MKNTDQILIKDLVVEMSAGIYDHEKINTQRVIINVTLDVQSNKGKTLNSINDVISYEVIANQIQELAQAQHYDFLEELAEKIAMLCLQKPKVHNAKIRVEKPDIIKNAGSVGVEIIRNTTA